MPATIKIEWKGSLISKNKAKIKHTHAAIMDVKRTMIVGSSE